MAVVESTPSTYGTATNYNYISTYQLRELINNDQLYKQLVRRFGAQISGISSILDEIGAARGIKSLNFFHDEEDRVKSIIKATCPGGLAGATAVATLVAGYNPSIPSAAQAPYIVTGAANSAPIRDNDIVGAKGILCKVSGVDRALNTFNLTPLVATDSVPALLTSDELPVYFNSWGEGTGQPDPLAVRRIQYANNLTNYKQTVKGTGAALGTASFFQNLGISGVSDRLFDENIFNAKRQAEIELEIMLLVSRKTTNTNLASTVPGQAQNTTTEGLIPFIENYGNVDTYSGSLAFSDLDSIIDAFYANKGAAEYAMFQSPAFKRAIDNLLRNTTGLTAGGVVYNHLGGEDKYVALEFGSFSYGGVTFHQKVLSGFADPTTLGAAGQGYSGTAILIPFDKSTQVIDGSKVNVPAMQKVYQDVAGENMGYKEWMTGSAGAVSTNDIDEQVINMRWRVGLECFAGNRFGLFKTA